jgi:cytochrome bd-type quinol oxidase subunit 2
MENSNNLVSFYLEHYRQMNEGLRDSDRNRNIVVGFYVTLTVAVLGLIFSTGGLGQTTESLTNETLQQPYDVLMKMVLGGFLFFTGITVAWYVTIARFWHCEQDRVAQAIHMMFTTGNLNLNLMETAKKVKERSKRGCFNWTGTEFWVMVFVPFILWTNGVVVLIAWLMPEKLWVMLTYSLIGLFILVFAAGILLYRCYLRRREKEFPCQSPFIMMENRTTLADDAKKPKRGQHNETS